MSEESKKDSASSGAETDLWGFVEGAPADAIFGLARQFRHDASAEKLSFVIGAYRQADGSPWVLPAVRKAEELMLAAKQNHEYLPQDGHAGFRDAAISLLYGADHEVVTSKRVMACQSIGGTGALRLGAAFAAKFLAGKAVYVSDPTWPNHMAVFSEAGVEVKRYRWLKEESETLAVDSIVSDLRAAAEGSVVLLHACAHNPSGVDPTHSEWEAIADVCEERKLQPFFDVAYQGFASGDVDADAWAVRMFARRGMAPFAAQSFSKNFGLYGERVGCFSIVCGSAAETARLRSNVKITARRMYSNPPQYGARIVYTVLSDAALRAQWLTECRMMADRIHGMRVLLKKELDARGKPHDWSHITSQIGMFSYSGLSGDQCDALRTDHHIYLPRNGRISMAAVTPDNVARLAQAMVSVMGIAKAA